MSDPTGTPVPQIWGSNPVPPAPPPPIDPVQMALKSGYQTPEFWVAMSLQVVAVLGLLGMIAPGELTGINEAVPKVIGAVFTLIVAAVGAIHYVQGRLSMKKAIIDKKLLVFFCLGGFLLAGSVRAADPVHNTALFGRRANCPQSQVVPVAPVVVMPQSAPVAAAVDPFSASNAAALQSIALSHQQLVSLLAMGGGGCLGRQAGPCQPSPAPPQVVPVAPVVVTPPISPVLPPSLPLPQQIIVNPQPVAPPQQVIPYQGAPQQVIPFQGSPQQVIPYQGAPQQVIPYQGAPQILLPVGPGVPQPAAPQQLLPVGPGTGPQQLLPVNPAGAQRPAPVPQRYAYFVVAQKRYVVINHVVYLVVK